MQAPFSGWFACVRPGCGQAVGVLGMCTYRYAETQCLPTPVKGVLRPIAMNPAPPVLALPQKVPEPIRATLASSFGLLWQNTESCANRLRVALELVLEDQGHPAVIRAGKRIALHQRIENFDLVAPDHRRTMFAKSIQWLGNVASRGGGPGVLLRRRQFRGRRAGRRLAPRPGRPSAGRGTGRRRDSGSEPEGGAQYGGPEQGRRSRRNADCDRRCFRPASRCGRRALPGRAPGSHGRLRDTCRATRPSDQRTTVARPAAAPGADRLPMVSSPRAARGTGRVSLRSLARPVQTATSPAPVSAGPAPARRARIPLLLSAAVRT